MGSGPQSMPMRQGFLLMEALVAILILASFSLVIGFYWAGCSMTHAESRNQLQALQIALDTLDKMAAGITTQQFESEQFSISIVQQELRVPAMVEAMPSAMLGKVTVTWKGFDNNFHNLDLESILIQRDSA